MTKMATMAINSKNFRMGRPMIFETLPEASEDAEEYSHHSNFHFQSLSKKPINNANLKIYRKKYNNNKMNGLAGSVWDCHIND